MSATDPPDKKKTPEPGKVPEGVDWEKMSWARPEPRPDASDLRRRPHPWVVVEKTEE